MTALSPATSDRLSLLSHQFKSRGAEALAAVQQATGALAGIVKRESFVMAYGDCFFLLGAVLLSTIVLVWFCRSASPRVLAAH